MLTFFPKKFSKARHSSVNNLEAAKLIKSFIAFPRIQIGESWAVRLGISPTEVGLKLGRDLGMSAKDLISTEI